MGTELLNKIRSKPVKHQILRINSAPGQQCTTWSKTPVPYQAPQTHMPKLSHWSPPSPPPRVGAKKGAGRESWAPHFELITAASAHRFSGEKHSLAIISSLIIRHSLVPNKLNSFTLRQSPRNQTNHLSQQDAAFKN
jgi:hypothetical protein